MFPSIVFTFVLSASAPLALVEETKPALVKLDDDPRKTYLLHGPNAGAKPPRDGWKLLVVMPGGDASADFAPFVGRIREHALGDEWLVAQMVAPVWDEKQAKELVWPTEKNAWKGMQFTCEEFFDAVVAHVETKHPLDPKYVFTLGWSSGGPLAYTLALRAETRVTGTFVAMSVFRPESLPKLEHAKGRGFHVLHSPEDWIPIAQAEKAKKDLEKHGASVELETYAGGHGWHGDVFGLIRSGIAGLEKTAKAPAKGKAKKPEKSKVQRAGR